VTEIEKLVEVAGDAAPQIDRIARFGFAAKGIVTILVGGLALRYAIGWGGRVTGPQGAIQSVLDEPFGPLILAVLALGLAGYAVWMFLAAIIDADRKGAGFRGIAERVSFFVTGVGYALLAYATVRLQLGRGGGGTSLNDLAAAVLTPWVGRWFVGLVGCCVIVAGLLQLRLGITGSFRDSLRHDLSKWERVFLVVVGGMGYMAIGALSLLVGSSLVEVAIEYDPSEAAGWDEALWVLSRLKEGPWLLGAVSVGLILYGFYSVLLVRYRAL
jgi:uncharacterized protein DUF1206